MKVILCEILVFTMQKPPKPAAGARGVRATATPRDHFAPKGGRGARRTVTVRPRLPRTDSYTTTSLV